MHNKNNKILKQINLLIVILLIISVYSCRKDEKKGNGPSISFKVDTGYVYRDDTVLIGKTFTVGIVSEKGDANITNFIIKVSNDSVSTYLDTGMNVAAFNIRKTIIKGIAPEDKWTFIVRDKSGNSASISFNIFADPNSTFGNIITIPSVILGAQKNTTIGSFLDIKNVIVHNLQQAFGVQDSIEMLYFYDAIQTDANTIASPYANIDNTIFSGTYGLSNWTVKNETRYLKTALSINEFNSFSNDSILIAYYNEALSKRKAKNLSTGDIYVFKTSKGKLGMFEVLNVSGTDAGTVEIKVKMQPN